MTLDPVRLSKRLAYVLRHAPGSVGLQLDEAGWVGVDLLLAALGDVRREDLETVVRTSPKQRFALSEDGRRVRANQGHSVPVDLGYAPAVPPAVLYHGTPERNLAPVLREGLRPGARHAVHLSADVETAQAVGSRRGRCVVLRVDAAAMARAGAGFTVSANGVWLVDAVPPQALTVLD